jgi:hypothetical protein
LEFECQDLYAATVAASAALGEPAGVLQLLDRHNREALKLPALIRAAR